MTPHQPSPVPEARTDADAAPADRASLERQIRQAIGREDWERALGLYAALRQRFGDTVDIFLGYGNCLLHLERGLPEARQAFEEAARRFPEARQPGERLAHLAARQGDFPTALERYAALCRRFPDYAGGLVGWADTLTTLGRHEEAEAMVEAFSRRHPEDAGAWHRRINLAQSLGQPQRMFELAEEGRRRFPGDVSKHLAVARAHIALNRFDAAEAVLAEVEDAFPEAPTGLSGRLWLATLKRAPKPAAALYGVIRRRFPHHLDGPMHYVRLLLRLEAFDQVEAVLGELLEAFAHKSGPWLDRARLAASRGDRDQARERFRQAAARFPDNYPAQAGYGQALLDTGDEAAALAFYEALRDRFPFRPGPSLHFARLACLAGRDEAAVACLAGLRDRFPDGYPGRPTSGPYAPVCYGFDAEEVLFTILANRFPGRLDLQLGFARLMR